MIKFPVLRFLRKKSYLTQKEMAIRLKISVSHLNYIERGVRTLSIDLLEKYAKYFKISTSEFLIINSLFLEERLPNDKEKTYLGDYGILYAYSICKYKGLFND